MQFDHSPVPAPQRMFQVKLRALRQTLVHFFERVRHKIRLAVIVAGKRMSSLDRAIHIVRNVGEERGSVSGFKVSENIAKLRKSCRHFDLLYSGSLRFPVVATS
jgi:hypothetical protein